MQAAALRWALAAFAAAVLVAAPASADIVFTVGNNPFPGEENLSLDGGALDTTVAGVGDTSGGTVTISAGENIVATSLPVGVAPSDGGLAAFTVTATGGWLITDFIVDLEVVADSVGQITVVEPLGDVSTFSFSLGNGTNFITINAINGQRISSIGFSVLSGGEFSAARSLRAGFDGSGVTRPVPEPAAWAMMLVGFGLIGAMLRRRRIPGTQY
jgi:hypothetical protein